MLKEERFEHVLVALKKKRKVTYESLALELYVSEDTIRRDIDQLHRNGLLTKVKGGAILRSINPLSFQDRADYLSDGKNIIALKAQQLIQPGNTIFMDGGTTICAVANRFPSDASFRVITNNIALVPILSKFRQVEVIVLGGSYHRDTETTVGMQACKEAELLNADIYLMGTCALHKHFGVTASVLEERELKKVMLQASRKKIVLCNWEKLDSTEPFKVCQISEIDTLVTDIPSDDKRLDGFRNLDIGIL